MNDMSLMSFDLHNIHFANRIYYPRETFIQIDICT